MSRETFAVGKDGWVVVSCRSCGRWYSWEHYTASMRGAATTLGLCPECQSQQDDEVRDNEVRYDGPRHDG